MFIVCCATKHRYLGTTYVVRQQKRTSVGAHDRKERRQNEPSVLVPGTYCRTKVPALLKLAQHIVAEIDDLRVPISPNVRSR